MDRSFRTTERWELVPEQCLPHGCTVTMNQESQGDTVLKENYQTGRRLGKTRHLGHLFPIIPILECLEDLIT